MAAVRRDGPELAYGGTPDAVPAHQTCHSAPAGSDALRTKDGMDARATIAAMVVAMDTPDLGQKLSVGSSPVVFRPPTPRVVAAGGHPEHPAHEPGRELVPVVLNEAEPHFGASEKMLMAFFKKCRVPAGRARARGAAAQSPPPARPAWPAWRCRIRQRRQTVSAAGGLGLPTLLFHDPGESWGRPSSACKSEHKP